MAESDGRRAGAAVTAGKTRALYFTVRYGTPVEDRARQARGLGAGGTGDRLPLTHSLWTSDQVVARTSAYPLPRLRGRERLAHMMVDHPLLTASVLQVSVEGGLSMRRGIV